MVLHLYAFQDGSGGLYFILQTHFQLILDDDWYGVAIEKRLSLVLAH